MSGICGILNLNGKPVSSEALRIIMHAMAYWGPDGSDIWQEGQIALGHLMLYGTPEAVYEKIPKKSRSGRLVITAAARIDNRKELFDAFEVPTPDRAHFTDSRLILKAYEKWGDRCPDHLLGDWSFAIWDSRLKKLFLARDHFGNTGLFYYSSNKIFAFASSLKGLLSLPRIPKQPNEFRIAQVLVSWADHGSHTLYKDILRLPPAHCLNVTMRGINARQYWYLENTPKLRLGSDQEYTEGFLEVFFEAVRCRLRSLRPVGSTLSGGLDSGSVSAIAAQELRIDDEILKVFSSVPIHSVDALVGSGHMGDERPLIEALCRHVGNIDVSYIRSEYVTPLGGIRRTLALHGEASHAAANFYWIIALMEKSREEGIGVLLTGQGGNAVISWNGRGYLPMLARKREWRSFFRELKAWSIANRIAIPRLLIEQVLRPLLPSGWRGRIRRMLFIGEPWADYSAINSQFAHDQALSEKMRVLKHDPTFCPNPDTRQSRLDLIQPGGHVVGSLWQQLGSGYGLDIRDPTFDKRVMEFCLSVPDDQHIRGGHGRMLIRRAMIGLLPQEVLWNQRRGMQAADLGWRVRSSWMEVRAALETVEKSELASRYLDIEKMKAVLDRSRVKVDRGVRAQCGNVLTRGLMVGLFLLGFE